APPEPVKATPPEPVKAAPHGTPRKQRPTEPRETGLSGAPGAMKPGIHGVPPTPGPLGHAGTRHAGTGHARLGVAVGHGTGPCGGMPGRFSPRRRWKRRRT